jgi:flagellar basal-body rod protein FlgG
MFDALYIAATGMQSQQLNVDTIANNIANVNTVGFKKGRVGFADLMVRDALGVQPTAEEASAGPIGSTRTLGSGVAVSSLNKVFDMGDVKKTGSALDIAIQGDGFIEVVMPDGSSAFTRGGSLKVSAEGVLTTQSGYPLKPQITLPDNAQDLIIDADGRVRVRLAKQADPVEVGQIEIVRFNSPGLLTAAGDNLYRATPGSGEAIAVRPGEQGASTLSQGYLESSNVKMVDELVNLMLAQRAYEANVKVVQAADEMLGMVNNLHK